jgi:hypothetical protein
MKRCLALAVFAGALVLPSPSWAEGGGTGQVSVRAARVAISAAGCRTVDVARVGRDIFGFVVYKFHQIKRWCWSYPRITSVSVSTYVSDVDPNMEYRGIFGSVSNYYTWCCGSGRSGHYSLRQGKFENCILWFPCTRTEYPWVKIRAHGNGSYTYATGI